MQYTTVMVQPPSSVHTHNQTYHNEPEYCYSATLDEIEQKGWSLVPSKYIEFKNRDEQIDFDTKMRQLQTPQP